MAWNPEPEVGAARDFGVNFDADQVVIVYLNTAKRTIGYASYGKTKRLCDAAKALAEAARSAVVAEYVKGES